MTLAGADPERAVLRVLIVPHAGAGAASGQPFAAHAPDDWLVATARLPGRESRIREAVPGLDGLVADVAGTIRGLPGSAPLVVVGVCSGAVIALEALRRSGSAGVAGLAVVAQWAVNEKPDPGRRVLRDADVADDRAEVLDILRDFGGVPDSLAANEEMLGLLLPAIVADIRAVEDYFCEPFDPGVPLLAVFGDEDQLCPEERTDGWSLFGARTRTVWLPGGHLLLADEPAALAAAVADNLDHWDVA
ncbi:thioesterase domain-containing protein [Streptomyces sp. NPDC050704]|uniref:thioesterase II family protein n=1 Tax=Streptomyces sp. NPDC050704 TaxID=3157219 RepID=UPI00342A14CE